MRKSYHQSPPFISHKHPLGDFPEDQHFLHYNPSSNQELPINCSAWAVFVRQESQKTQHIILEYKTSPCINLSSSGVCQKGNSCQFYHSSLERRRSPFVNNKLMYSSSICPYVLKRQPCEKGDQCPWTHNQCEITYHPTKFKTTFCNQSVECTNEFCPFAHTPVDLRPDTLIQAYMQNSQLLQPFTLTGMYALPQQVYSEYPQATNQICLQNYPAMATELQTFKTQPCSLQFQHNHKHCPFFHSAKDRRRIPGCYTADRCEEGENEVCAQGDSCQKSHSMVERLYHPDKYKTKYCIKFPNRLSECEYGEYCCFAHLDEELKVELIHNLERDEDFYLFYFKTVWCPYIHEHNKAMCVYAHNWQDFRRKPHLFDYLPIMCPNWQSETFICTYKEGCPFEQTCKYSHGWKEQLYHPKFYKINPCPDSPACQNKKDCPYFHGSKDRRYSGKVCMPRIRAYVKNPNITISNNVNAQREYEIQQMQTLLCIQSNQRRYSEEINHPSYTVDNYYKATQQNVETKNRARCDSFAPKCPPIYSPLKNIREESPDQKDSPPIEDKTLMEVFSSNVDKTKSSFLFFTPLKSKSKGTSVVPNDKEKSNSCPVTPILKRISHKKPAIFEKLHIGKELDECEEGDSSLIKLKKTFISIGQEKNFNLFAQKGLSANDILLMSKEDFKEIGILDQKDIDSILLNLENILEIQFEENLTLNSIYFYFRLLRKRRKFSYRKFF